MSQSELPLTLPKCTSAVTIDADLSEWKNQAFSDGQWDLDRVQQSPWFQPKRNRLTVEIHEDTSMIDLRSEYYMAWDQNFLYLGAEIMDNVHDVEETKHEPKRWYYKDAVAWFFEVPRDSFSEKFELGDHGFAFVLDAAKPDYGAWWRHGGINQAYIEEPIPDDAHTYAVSISKTENGQMKYTLEARIKLDATVGRDAPGWKGFSVGDRVGCMVVHCDPDGGEYGGHLLIYGQGDDDATWSSFEIVESENE